LKENFSISVVNGKITKVKEHFINAKLEDGTEVKVEGDALAEGAKVVVVTPDAEIPAPDGVHKLEDGTEIETKDGMIASIKEAVSEEMEEGKEDEMPEGVDGGQAIEIELMDMLKEFVKKISEKMSDMEEKVEEMNAEFKAFKKEPAGRKISDGKTEFNKEISGYNSADDKVAAIMAMRESNKK
jgi:preprotein translocase subunit YajC